MSDNIEVLITQGETVEVDIVQGEVTTAQNVGGEKEVYKEKTNATLKFRTIKAGANMTINQNTNDIEIIGPTPGETNTASNVGAEKQVFKQKTGVDFEFRTLKAGSNITLTQNANDIEIASTGGGSTTRIEDVATTTYVDTEETANVVNIGSTATGTSLIAKFIGDTGGTPVEKLQIDGNGDLSRTGNALLWYDSDNSIFIATQSTHSSKSGALTNIFMGRFSGEDLTGGDANVMIGDLNGREITSATNNTGVGYRALTKIVTNQKNTAYGAYSGNINVGSSCVFIGYYAGGRQATTSNKLIIDNQDRSSAANELTNALIVGDFAASPTSQNLTINGYTFLSTIKSGATQVGAGAAANEIWKTASHATLPDNVLMIGV